MTPALEEELRKLTEDDPRGSGAFAEGFRRSVRNWDERFASDRQRARIEFDIARCGRIMAVDHESTPQYAEAMRLDRHLRDRLREDTACRSPDPSPQRAHGAA